MTSNHMNKTVDYRFTVSPTSEDETVCSVGQKAVRIHVPRSSLWHPANAAVVDRLVRQAVSSADNTQCERKALTSILPYLVHQFLTASEAVKQLVEARSVKNDEQSRQASRVVMAAQVIVKAFHFSSLLDAVLSTESGKFNQDRSSLEAGHCRRVLFLCAAALIAAIKRMSSDQLAQFLFQTTKTGQVPLLDIMENTATVDVIQRRLLSLLDAQKIAPLDRREGLETHTDTVLSKMAEKGRMYLKEFMLAVRTVIMDCKNETEWIFKLPVMERFGKMTLTELKRIERTGHPSDTQAKILISAYADLVHLLPLTRQNSNTAVESNKIRLLSRPLMVVRNSFLPISRPAIQKSQLSTHAVHCLTSLRTYIAKFVELSKFQKDKHQENTEDVIQQDITLLKDFDMLLLSFISLLSSISTQDLQSECQSTVLAAKAHSQFFKDLNMYLRKTTNRQLAFTTFVLPILEHLNTYHYNWSLSQEFILRLYQTQPSLRDSLVEYLFTTAANRSSEAHSPSHANSSSVRTWCIRVLGNMKQRDPSNIILFLQSLFDDPLYQIRLTVAKAIAKQSLVFDSSNKRDIGKHPFAFIVRGTSSATHLLKHFRARLQWREIQTFGLWAYYSTSLFIANYYEERKRQSPSTGGQRRDAKLRTYLKDASQHINVMLLRTGTYHRQIAAYVIIGLVEGTVRWSRVFNYAVELLFDYLLELRQDKDWTVRMIVVDMCARFIFKIKRSAESEDGLRIHQIHKLVQDGWRTDDNEMVEMSNESLCRLFAIVGSMFLGDLSIDEPLDLDSTDIESRVGNLARRVWRHGQTTLHKQIGSCLPIMQTRTKGIRGSPQHISKKQQSPQLSHKQAQVLAEPIETEPKSLLRSYYRDVERMNSEIRRFEAERMAAGKREFENKFGIGPQRQDLATASREHNDSPWIDIETEPVTFIRLFDHQVERINAEIKRFESEGAESAWENTDPAPCLPVHHQVGQDVTFQDQTTKTALRSSSRMRKHHSPKRTPPDSIPNDGNRAPGDSPLAASNFCNSTAKTQKTPTRGNNYARNDAYMTEEELQTQPHNAPSHSETPEKRFDIMELYTQDRKIQPQISPLHRQLHQGVIIAPELIRSPPKSTLSESFNEETSEANVLPEFSTPEDEFAGQAVDAIHQSNLDMNNGDVHLPEISAIAASTPMQFTLSDAEISVAAEESVVAEYVATEKGSKSVAIQVCEQIPTLKIESATYIDDQDAQLRQSQTKNVNNAHSFNVTNGFGPSLLSMVNNMSFNNPMITTPRIRKAVEYVMKCLAFDYEQFVGVDYKERLNTDLVDVSGDIAPESMTVTESLHPSLREVFVTDPSLFVQYCSSMTWDKRLLNSSPSTQRILGLVQIHEHLLSLSRVLFDLSHKLHQKTLPLAQTMLIVRDQISLKSACLMDSARRGSISMEQMTLLNAKQFSSNASMILKVITGLKNGASQDGSLQTNGNGKNAPAGSNVFLSWIGRGEDPLKSSQINAVN